MINFDPIDHKLFVGSCPTSIVDVDRMATALEITAVLNLQSDEDLRRYRIPWPALSNRYSTKGIVVERHPIRDLDPDDLRERLHGPVDALGVLLSDGHCVYVHCNAGICRAPATIIGYMHKHCGMELTSALSLVREVRPIANPYMEAVTAALGGSGCQS